MEVNSCGCVGGGTDLLSPVSSDTAQENGMKLGKFGLDIRKRFFSGRVAGHPLGSKLHTEVVTAQILPEFKNNA